MLCHDPRRCLDLDCKVETDNPALIQAEIIRGWGMKVEWDRVAAMADYCDEMVDWTPRERPILALDWLKRFGR